MSKTSPARRRVTVARAHAAATRTFEATARLLRNTQAHPDAALLAGCVTYAGVRRRTDQLSRAKTDLGEAALERAHAELHEAASSALAAVAAHRAVTPEGHRTRAAAILFWDEGELIRQVEKYDILQDRLLLALLADLVEL